MSELTINISEGCENCCECCTTKNFECLLGYIAKFAGVVIIAIHIMLIVMAIVYTITFSATSENIEWMPLSLSIIWTIGNIIYLVIFWSNFWATEFEKKLKHLEGHDLICEKYPKMRKIPYVIYGINFIISIITWLFCVIYGQINYSNLQQEEVLQPLINEFYFMVAYYFYLFIMIGIYYLITLSVQKKDKKGNIIN